MSETEQTNNKEYRDYANIDGISGNTKHRMEEMLEEMIDLFQKNESIRHDFDIKERIWDIEQKMHQIERVQEGIIREIIDIKSKFMNENEKSVPMQFETLDLKTPSQNTEPVMKSFLQKKYTPYVPINYNWPTESKQTQKSAEEISRERINDYFDPFKNNSFEREMIPDFGLKNIFDINETNRKSLSQILDFEELKSTDLKDEENKKIRKPWPDTSGMDDFYKADPFMAIGYEVPESLPKEPEYINLPFKPEKNPDQKERSNEYKRIQSVSKKHIYTDDDDTDYNADCEYIIADKDMDGKKIKRNMGTKKEKIITNDEEDSEIIINQ